MDTRSSNNRMRGSATALPRPLSGIIRRRGGGECTWHSSSPRVIFSKSKTRTFSAAAHKRNRNEQNNGLNSTPLTVPKKEEEKEEDQRSINDGKEGKEVIILWDLDNVNPGTTCERFAINAQRIKKAGEKFGKVVSFKAFAGMQTSRDLSECCTSKGFKEIFEKLNLKTEFNLDGPDAADLQLGKRMMEFANESQGKRREHIPDFITRRAEEARFLTTDDDDDNDDDEKKNSMDNEEEYDNEEDNTITVSFKPELKHVSFCEKIRGKYRNLAVAKQESLKLDGEKIHAMCLKERCSPDETKLRQIVKNRKYVAIVVTNDRDLKLPLDYAISMDVCVVLIGNFVDNSSKKMKNLVSASSRKKKTSFRRLGGGGRRKESLNQVSWNVYLDTVRLAAQKRPIGRLKLLENADAALIWDAKLRFRVSEDERDVLVNSKSNNSEFETSCPGDIVGIWRRHKSGVGAWFSSFDEDR